MIGVTYLETTNLVFEIYLFCEFISITYTPTAKLDALICICLSSGLILFEKSVMDRLKNVRYENRPLIDFFTAGFSSTDRSMKDAFRVEYVCSLARMNQRIKPSRASSIIASNIIPLNRIGDHIRRRPSWGLILSHGLF